MRRGQATITAIEAGIGVLLLLALTLLFALGSPGGSDSATQAQLDAYAEDTATILAQEQPRHADQTRLAEVTASGAAFEREAPALERRIEAILPENVFFRLDTPYGRIGHPLPANVQTGTTTVTTVNGPVTLEVWYA
ncbi:hypothetical protein GRX03_03715 [Halovenus sp. WSH3]|uniref:Uncharacterized protein n=1 Tax=Halovenus carboxidivorans TaxID=2692199 RepID=A0A6B0SZ59_9EURY|nr:hypothetical protein [Halovenus carboxidivorans]MXR50715.1 hypothetical protein [Halovenus carboxidivorans]